MSKIDLPALALHDAGVAVYPPGSSFGPRLLDDYILVWLAQGQAELRLDGQSWAAKPGDLALGRPGMRDQYLWDRRGRTVHGYVHFGVERLPPSWPDPARWPRHIRLGEDAPAEALLRLFFAQYAAARQGAATAGLELNALQLLLKLVVFRLETAGPALAGLPLPVTRALDGVRSFLTRAPGPAPTLGELAQMAGVSREHLCRLFGRHLKRSPQEVLRLARLARAESLLRRSNHSIKEIAAICGFPDPYHFSKLFKKSYRASPRAFRGQAASKSLPLIEDPLGQVLQFELLEARQIRRG